LSTKLPDPRGPGEEILCIVKEQVSLGPRVPGSKAHAALAGMLMERTRLSSAEVILQDFPVAFRGSTLSCRNIIGVFRAKTGQCRQPPLLLGTHYDTRVRADREGDPTRQERPIPGANDGGSGTAVLLHLLPWLAARENDRDVVVAFFDAEDLGNIDGKDFSLGAAWCAEHPVAGLEPAEVVVLDMVGGRDMILDIDAGAFTHLPSRRLTAELFRIGSDQQWQPFTRDKPNRVKHIISDHYPFACGGTASCILIDIDYPQWHTLRDTPEALSASSLGIIEAVLQLFLARRQP
jgi:glutaminyl-peptide cyclotransferase